MDQCQVRKRLCYQDKMRVFTLDAQILQDDFMEFMLTSEDPYTALSINVSECYGSLDTDPTFVEMLARVLYHVMMNSFRIAADGKF